MHSQCLFVVTGLLAALVQLSFSVETFSTTSEMNSITISWTDDIQTYIANFTIYQDNVVVHTVEGTMSAGSHRIGGLFNGSMYTIAVQGLDENGTVYMLYETQKATKPPAPTNVFVEAHSETQLSISWDTQADTTYTVSYRKSTATEVTSTGCAQPVCTITVTSDNDKAGLAYVVLVVATKHDEQSAAASESGNTKPKPPDNLKVSAVSTSELSVEWELAANSQQNDSGYVVSYNVVGSTTEAVKLGCHKSPCSLSTSEHPGTAYSFSVKATSGNAESQPTVAQGNTKPLPPANVQVTGVDTSTILVSWVPAANSVQNENAYKMSYSYTGESGQMHTVEKGDCKKSPCQLKLTQKAGTTYVVTVQSLSGVEYSEQRSGSGNTLPATPTITELSAVDTTTLRVTWEPGKDSIQTGYRVSYSATSSTITQVLVSCAASPCDIDTAGSAGTQYTVFVNATVGDEQSLPASTTAYTKPASPASVTRDKEATTKSLSVTWVEPASGNFQSYYLTVKQVGVTQILHTRTIKKETHSAVFENLPRPGAEYDVTVQTEAGSEKSKPISKTFRIKPLSASNLATTSVTRSRLEVSWNSPTDSDYTGFTVKLSEVSTTQKSFDSSTTSTSFSDLLAGNAYTVMVTTVSGDQTSEDLSDVFFTKPNDVPGALEVSAVGTDTMTVSWQAPTDGSFDGFLVSLQKDGGTTVNTVEAGVNQRQHQFISLQSALAYTVTVKTKAGNMYSEQKTASFTTMPLAPSNLKVSGRTTSSLSLTWTPSASAVDSYEYTVSRAGDSKTGTKQDTSVTISDLVAGGTYNIHVMAVKNNVKSEPTTTISATLIPENVKELKTTNVAKTSIELSWKPPSGDYSSFQIIVTNPTGEIVADKEIARSVRSDEIGSLVTGTKYKVTMYTMSEKQKSSGVAISATTQLPNITSFEVLGKTVSTISVKWDSPGGTFLRYELKIEPNDGSLSLPIQVDSATATLQYEFTDLQAGQTYTCSIRVVSSAISSTWEQRQITTNPLAVTSLSVQSVSTTEMTVVWKSDANSKQDDFKVVYTIQSEPSHKEVTVSSEENKLEYSIRLDQLSPGHTYQVEVFASSNNINSDTKTVQSTTKPLPVVGLSAKTLAADQVKLSWTPGSGGKQVCYKLRHKGTHAVLKTWSAWQQVAEESVTVKMLFPGDTYQFEVVAYSNSQMSESSKKSAILYPLPPNELTVDRSKTTSSSFTLGWKKFSSASYRTHWRIVYATKGISDSTEKTVLANRTSLTIDHLVSGQNYTVKVYGVTTNDILSQDTASAYATVLPVITTQLSEIVPQTTTSVVAVLYSKPQSGSGVFDYYLFSINHDKGGQQLKRQHDALERSVRFVNLNAGTEYTVNAVTYSGNERSLDQKHISVITVPEAASIKCVEDREQITVQLSSSAGHLDLFELRCDSCTDAMADPVIVTVNDPRDEYAHTYTQLTPFTRYAFSVLTKRAHKHSSSKSIECKTQEREPAAVDQASVRWLKPYELELSWQRPLQTNGILTKYTVKYNGTKQGQQTDIGNTITIKNVSSRTYKIKISNLIPGYLYKIWIRAHTNLEGKPAILNITMPVIAPFFEDSFMSRAQPTVAIDSVQHDTFQILLLNPFSDKNGAVISYSVIVTTDLGDTSSKSDNLPSWATAQRDGLNSYVAVYQCKKLFEIGDGCWKERGKRETRAKRATPGDQVVFTLGGDTQCDPVNVNQFCNGGLKSDTDYFVKVRAYTETQYADTPFSDAIHTAAVTDSGLVTWQITVIAVAAALLVIIAIAVIFICIKRRSGKKMETSAPETMHMTGNRSKREVTSKPIKLADFEASFKEKMADSEYLFGEEFEDLNSVGREQSMIAAELAVNQPKNRFINILPFDVTRVTILPAPHDPDASDYINGNWLDGFNMQREYMVMQGPLTATINHFWQAIWEYGVRTIVMLTETIENGRVKCSTYWPRSNQPVVYGSVKVRVLQVVTDSNWVITYLQLSKDNKTLLTKHYRYTAWLDWQASTDPRSIVNFVQLVRGQMSKDGGQMLVHCSAGVGRSGTFIAIDWLLQHIKEYDYVDIYGIVYKMRKQRIYMVQEERQYIFIHRCMLSVLTGYDGGKSGTDNAAYDEDEGFVS